MFYHGIKSVYQTHNALIVYGLHGAWLASDKRVEDQSEPDHLTNNIREDPCR